MKNNQTTKKSFWKDIKIIIILILFVLLIIVSVLYIISMTNKNKIYDLQAQIQDLNTSNNELSSQIEENKTKISELENNNNVLQQEKEALQTEIQQLENDKTNLSSQLAKSKKSSSTTNTTKPTTSSIVGIWSSSVTAPEYSSETHTSQEVTYTTTYEFKDNGDFYVDGNKVGTYKDNSIFFKDSNDPNYRTASYNFKNNILYVNLYQGKNDIYVSTNFYKCEKK